jgi:predicted phage-related endonuclease
VTLALRTEDVTSFSADAEWTGVRSIDVGPWLGLRKTMLTASDIAAVMGEDENRSALDVYVDKRVDTPPPEKLPPWDARRVGAILEQPLLADVALYRGWRYRAGGYLLRSKKYPFLGATLDAEIERGDGAWCDFEGKTTELIGNWDEDSGQMPTRVLLQVQTQLLVTGAEVAIVFALLRRYRPVQIEVYRNEQLHEIIVDYAERFMGMVAREERPPPDSSKSARCALHRLFPIENGDVVDLPPEALGWTREYQEIAEELRRLEDRKRFLQNQLKNALGGATYGLLPEDIGGKSCWRWQTQSRAAHAVDDSESRVLLALKNPPQGARPGHYPPELAKPDTTLEKLLEASSLEENDPPGVIRIGKKRRRTR